MSARDAESGSSTYKGGSRSAGGLGNGGIGGGMGGGGNWGGGFGGGAGRNGGIGNRTGLTTGNRMYGGMAVGRPGGPAMNPGAWGIRAAAPIGTGPLSGVPRPAAVPGVNPVPENVPPASYVPNVFNQNYLNSISDFVQSMKNRYGWGANNPNITPGPGPTPAPAPAPSFNPYSALSTYKSPYGPEAISMVGSPNIGLAQYSRENAQANANFGYDPGYTAPASSMTSQSSRGWGGWNTPWN